MLNIVFINVLYIQKSDWWWSEFKRFQAIERERRKERRRERTEERERKKKRKKKEEKERSGDLFLNQAAGDISSYEGEIYLGRNQTDVNPQRNTVHSPWCTATNTTEVRSFERLISLQCVYVCASYFLNFFEWNS